MQEPIEIKPASERYPECFEITANVISTLVKWIEVEGVPAPRTALGFVKIASVMRSYNIYKSINLLLGTDHWEEAAIIARSLFELLLNLEEVLRDTAAAEKRAKRYLRFNKLQEHLHVISSVEYDLQTGRCSKKRASLLGKAKKLAESIFGEFRDGKRPSGWDRSWCRKSVFKLAEASENAMRTHQYKIIYSYFSDLCHSGPYPTMTTIKEPQPQEEDDSVFIAKRDDSEKENLVTVLMLSTVWLMEILLLASSEVPAYDVKWNSDVMRQIFTLYGSGPSSEDS